ncbi:MAG: glycosyltransferase [Candidatus Krumholzibacteriia bacterium]
MHLLYIATNFGSLTHTFIAREVTALRERGVTVDLLALRPARKAQAAAPECDLTGCRYVFPVPWWRVVTAGLGLAIRRPGRWSRAVRVALGSPGDGLITRLKLLGQLAVSATAVRTVESLRPDLMHAHLANPPGSYAMFLSLLTGIPYSFTAHAADLYRRPVGNRAKLIHAAGAVAISRYNLDHYRTLVPGYDRSAIVHCGVRPEDFPFRRREAAGPLGILAVGRAVPKKGFGDLLTALARLTAAGVAWRGQLVGGGPLLADLRARRDELGLTSLEITGPLQQPEVRRLLDAADVFVLPCVPAADGDVDGIPVSLMEAMAAGCPVVSTRVSGIPELLDDGRAGLLVAPHAPEELAAALARLATEPGLAAELGHRGHERICEEFDVRREAVKLETFFAQLRGRRTVC